MSESCKHLQCKPNSLKRNQRDHAFCLCWDSSWPQGNITHFHLLLVILGALKEWILSSHYPNFGWHCLWLSFFFLSLLNGLVFHQPHQLTKLSPSSPESCPESPVPEGESSNSALSCPKPFVKTHQRFLRWLQLIRLKCQVVCCLYTTKLSGAPKINSAFWYKHDLPAPKHNDPHK